MASCSARRWCGPIATASRRKRGGSRHRRFAALTLVTGFGCAKHGLTQAKGSLRFIRADARAEGLGDADFDGMDPRCWYRDLWDNLHTAEGERWDDNPEIIALTYRVERRNIDTLSNNTGKDQHYE